MSKCAVETCQREAAPGRRGWCPAHYQKWWKHGDPLANHLPIPNNGKCAVEGCNKPPRSRTSPHCEMHYGRLRRTGTLETTINMEPSAHCLHCNVKLGEKRVGSKFCSDRCSARYYRHAPLQIKCAVCGALFTPVYGAEVCSAECGEKAKAALFKAWQAEHRDDPAYRERIRQAGHKRRFQKFNTAITDFRISDIFERDNWICALCGKPVDRSAAWPLPNSPSIDHIVPLSRGGPHTPDNVQLAHLRCNLKKSTKSAI